MFSRTTDHTHRLRAPVSRAALRLSCSALCVAMGVTGLTACSSGTSERVVRPVATSPAASPASPSAPASVPASPSASVTGGGGAPGSTVPDPAATGTAPAPAADANAPVTRHGQLQVMGAKVVDAAGQPVTLRGQGFGWDNWWPQYYNADVVNWLRDDWCVDMVRPAMGIEPDGAYLSDPAASRARMVAVVDAAIAKGVYVIIDWHAHENHQAEAIAFFTDMAQTYGSNPHVLYEIWNEPTNENTWEEVKAYSEAVIAAIRQHDPDNLVIVGSPEWNQRIDQVAAAPLSGVTNVVYSVHFYAATHTDWLRERTQAAIDGGIPVIVSESSGSEASGMGDNNLEEWQAWFDFMDANQISWINYSVSDKAGETISVLEPGAPATAGWDATQLTPTGEYIRDVFRSYCQ